MKTTTDFQTASEAVRKGEALGYSDRKMSKLWKVYFAAEDAMKADRGVWR